MIINKIQNSIKIWIIKYRHYQPKFLFLQIELYLKQKNIVILKGLGCDYIDEAFIILKGNLPHDVKNGDIVNTLIVDIVNNSIDKETLSFSPTIFDALNQLKEWNYKNIYLNPKKSSQDAKIKTMFLTVLEECMEELDSSKKVTGINHWFNSMNEAYKSKTSKSRVVADYVSGMTDDFLMNTYKEIVIPKSFGINFSDSHQECASTLHHCKITS